MGFLHILSNTYVIYASDNFLGSPLGFCNKVLDMIISVPNFNAL